MAVGAIALVATACNALLSIHTLDGGGADGATDAGTLTLGSSACMACAATSCGTESTACANDPTVCTPYENCLGRCNGDPACRSQCTIANELPLGGSQAVSELSACLVSHCETKCGLQCGSFAANLSEPDAAAECQRCFVNACDQSRACASSADCDAYWRCYRACPTPDCKFSCAAEHEAGAALFRPLQSEFAGTCAPACAYGNYWACIGKVSWPTAESKQVDFTFPVVDLFYSTPIPGEQLTVCGDCPCTTAATQPLGMGTTDEAGIATVRVNQPPTSTGQGLNGCVQVSSPTDATVPYYGYWGYPLSQPINDPRQGPASTATNVAAQSVQVFTPDELQAAAAFVDAGLIPGRGFVGAAVFDCLANATPGAQVTLDPADPLVTTVYPGTGSGNATHGPGLEFLVNVSPGRYTVRAMPGPLDGGVSSVQTIRVDPDTTTAVGMFPTPMP